MNPKNKKLNFFENVYCGWIHIFDLFYLWREVMYRPYCSQSSVFFNFIQYDHPAMVEFTWWRGKSYNLLR